MKALASYFSHTANRYEEDVLKAINAVGFVYREHLPSGFTSESLRRLNEKFAKARLVYRLKFTGSKLGFVKAPQH